MSRVVVVTGASAGLGRAIVQQFAADGWDVALIARGEAGLNAAANEVRGQGQRALVLPVDVSDASAVEAATKRIEDELGEIDVWVNDAMESVFAPVHEITADEFKRVTEVNYLGYVYCTLAALRRMRPRDRGTIIYVGSALAFRSIPLQAPYCASKHAIVGFTDSLRCELIHDRSRIRLCAVHMPALNTPQFSWVRSRLPRKAQPVPPIFDPEVGARAVLYVAKHPRRDLFVGTPTLFAVWGQRFMPSLLDLYLGKTGYRAQQTGIECQPRPDNLNAPLDADSDWGAHGRFDDRSRSRSPALQLSIHRGLAMAISAIAGGVAAVVLARRERNFG
jgi:NAD(P)-dependent dehydrogenase (short-subunit alcohol dehydrogenase family)